MKIMVAFLGKKNKKHKKYIDISKCTKNLSNVYIKNKKTSCRK